MKPQVMSMERFRQLVSAYGAKLECWPERERESARALLEESESARALLSSESNFDELLGELPAPTLTPDFERRLNEVPLRAKQARKFPFRLFWPALGWAAAAGIGLAFGVLSARGEEVSAALVENAEVQTTETDEVLALATGSFGDLTDNLEDSP